MASLHISIVNQIFRSVRIKRMVKFGKVKLRNPSTASAVYEKNMVNLSDQILYISKPSEEFTWSLFHVFYASQSGN